MLVAGLGFKLSAVPFHMWAPDTYEGAPLPVTAYLAIGSNAAAFALTLRLFAEAVAPAADRWGEWQLVIAILAALTMLLGNLVALAQSNLKRLMAYSSIGHVGYALAGVAVLGSDFALAAKAVIFYLVVYAVTNLWCSPELPLTITAKARMISQIWRAGRPATLPGCRHCHRPVLAGRVADFRRVYRQFYLFAAVADGGFLWLAGVAVFSSLVSLYYYLQVLRQMYIEPARGHHDAAGELGVDHHPASHGHDQPGEAPPPLQRPSILLTATMGVGVLVVTWLGVYPAPLLALIETASSAILPLG